MQTFLQTEGTYLEHLVHALEGNSNVEQDDMVYDPFIVSSWDYLCNVFTSWSLSHDEFVVCFL